MSSHAVDELNSALIVLDPVVDNGLVRTSKLRAQGLAAYLHAQVGPERRVETWHRRLSEITTRLRT